MKTNCTKNNNVSYSKGYPKDLKVLQDIALNLASGEMDKFSSARDKALEKFGYELNDANRRRIWEWYKKGDWAEWGRNEYIEREIRQRGMQVKRNESNPHLFRMQLRDML